MLDLVTLRSFVHVCERGTIAAAASDLDYTAPAVSQQIAKLERDLGAAVFDRVGGRLSPNAAGVELLRLATSMLDLAERCQQIPTTPSDPKPVVVAAFASAINAVVKPALPSLSGYRVSVFGADDDEALRRLRLGQVDVALVQRYDHTDFAEDPRLNYRQVASDRLRLVLPCDRLASTRLAQLAGVDWLLNGDDTQCTHAVLSLLNKAGIEPAIRGSLEDNHSLLALVSAGLGVCIVPELVLTETRNDVDVTVATQRLGAKRTIHAVTRRSGDPAHADVVSKLAQTGR